MDTIVVGDFIAPFTSMDKLFRQKMDKETSSLNIIH